MAFIAPKPKGECPRVEGKMCYTFRAACHVISYDYFISQSASSICCMHFTATIRHVISLY